MINVLFENTTHCGDGQSKDSKIIMKYGPEHSIEGYNITNTTANTQITKIVLIRPT